MQRQLVQALPDLGADRLCAPDTRGAGSCSPENPYLCTAGPSHLGCASSPWAVGAGADCQSQCMHPGFVYAANQTGYSLDSGQEQVLRYIVAASGILSLLGSAVIMWSALRFTSQRLPANCSTASRLGVTRPGVSQELRGWGLSGATGRFGSGSSFSSSPQQLMQRFSIELSARGRFGRRDAAREPDVATRDGGAGRAAPSFDPLGR